MEAPPRPPEVRPVEEPRLNPNDFPSLGGGASVPSIGTSGGSRGRGGGGVMIRAVGRPAMTKENFPALSNSSPAPSHKVILYF